MAAHLGNMASEQKPLLINEDDDFESGNNVHPPPSSPIPLIKQHSFLPATITSISTKMEIITSHVILRADARVTRLVRSYVSF